MSVATVPTFQVELAKTPEDLREAQRLRYDVFIDELGGSGAGVDHINRLEGDSFDAFADHLLLRDTTRPRGAQIIGTYRLIGQGAAQKAGGFYSDREFDLGLLEGLGRNLLELGRSCLHRDYRGGRAMAQLWAGLADYVRTREIEILFGVASFSTTNPDEIAAPLSHLHHGYLAPKSLRVTSRDPAQAALIAPEQIDRLAAMRNTPALIKAYLRLGGVIGQGAFVDHVFNTTDICMILDTKRLNSAAADQFLGQGPL